MSCWRPSLSDAAAAPFRPWAWKFALTTTVWLRRRERLTYDNGFSVVSRDEVSFV
jgi:hypothetical protein